MKRVTTGGLVALALVLAAVGGIALALARPVLGPSEEGAPAQPEGPDGAPRVIPEVSSWEPADGDGWAPTGDSRVVVDPDGPLGEIADRLGTELDLPVHDGPARTGDVVLELDEDDETDPGGGVDSDGSEDAVVAAGPEGYVLASRDGELTISGSAEAGVFYGTRTLVQAVRDRGGVAEGVIRDAPDRPQRGLLLDTARKHFPADWIEERLHLMADLKLNQLQLHFSDDQGFRVESEEYPEIVADEHLTKDEVRHLVEVAESLHITVIPEIDSPGHLQAVLDAHPDLRLRDADGDPVDGAVDIANPRAGELLDGLAREFVELFPGPYWHVGGDEYRAVTASDPEASFPELAAAARDEFGPDAGVRDLAAAWLNDRAEAVRDLDRVPQVWNDGMHAGGVVDDSAEREVTYWTGREYGARPPEEYLEGGWPVLNMSSEYLYYVLGEPHDFTYPTGERIYREWTPEVLRGTEPVAEELGGVDRIPGGRFAVWCDLADEQSTAEVADGIRMPLHATAQKLWHPGDPDPSWEDFTALADRVDAGAAGR